METWIIITIVVAAAVLLCFLLAVANFSGERFMEHYEEVNKIEVRCDQKPLQFVQEINKKHFGGKLRVGMVAKRAADAYAQGVIYLSPQTASINSIASFTIIAHELGHALQDKEGNKLRRMRVLRRLGRVLGLLLAPCLIAGAVLAILGMGLVSLILIGSAAFIFLLALYVKLRTISIEKDASKKALVLLDEYMTEEELKISKKFLNSAKLTYWADFLRVFLWWTAMSRKTKLFN